MDPLNLEITKAQENLKFAGIDFDVVDSCPDLTCEVCLDRNLSVAA